MGHLKHNFIRDAQSMMQLLSTTPAENVTEDDLYGSIGLELFLNRDLARRANERKRAHVKAIISAQRIYDKDQLAYLSTTSSRWARNRAATLALGYSNFSQE